MIDLNQNIVSKTKPLTDYLNTQRQNRKFAESLEFGCTMFLIVFFLLFAIRPTILTISALIGEINSKKNLSANLKTKINSIIQAQDAFSTVQQRYLIVDSSLPSSPKYVDATNQVISSAAKSNIVLDTVNFSLDSQSNNGNKIPTTPNKNLHYYQIVVSSPSDFSSFIQYLDHLTNNRRYFEMPTVSIGNFSEGTNKKEGIDPNKLTFKISLNTFYWQP